MYTINLSDETTNDREPLFIIKYCCKFEIQDVIHPKLIMNIHLRINLRHKVFFILLTLCSLSQDCIAQVCFEDIADDYGLSVSYFGGLSGGLSFVDFDQDGWDDLTIAGQSNVNIQFYRNLNGQGFEEVILPIFVQEETKQVIWVDIDNDQDLDFYATTYDGVNRLYENTGYPNFNEITLQSGLPIELNRSHGAVWADFNRDGFLDLYHSDRKLPISLPENRNRLWLNNRDNTFTEFSQYSMTEDAGKLPFCAGILDYDKDGWPDIYVANDRAGGNAMFKNNTDSTFTEISQSLGTYFDMDAMTVTLGDINNDGYQDFYLTNIPEGGNKLLINNCDTNGTLFCEEAEERGLKFENMSWGANFVDIDLDSDLDIYITGSTATSANRRLYVNDGLGYFSPSEICMSGDSLRSNATAIGDINNDGKYEIAVFNNFGDNIQLWEEKNVVSYNSIAIKLRGIKSNYQGTGSEIKVCTNGKCQYQYTTTGNGFLAQNSEQYIFGSSESTTIDSVIVTWPTGHIDVLHDLSTGAKIIITEGESTNGIILIDEQIKHLYPTETFFTESAIELGIDHVHAHQNFLGGGVAIFDYNNDGHQDIYLTGGTETDRLYHNNGDGSFEDITINAGIFLTSFYYTNGVITADVDNDGYEDIFVLTKGTDFDAYAKNLLFHNQGDGTFVEKWLINTPLDNTDAMGASFIDYNQDGFLDIYVISYVESSAFLTDDNGVIIGYDHDCFENRLYRNNGSILDFTDVTNSIIISDEGCSLAVMSSDIDQDGLSELLTANDFGEFISPNTLYQFDSLSQRWNEISHEVNFDFEIYGMGITSTDYRHDLDFDYYITNIGSNIFLENNDGNFSDQAQLLGIDDQWIIEDSITSVSWGANFFDYNNDGYDDLYIANGYVPTPSFLSSNILNQDRFYSQNEDFSFNEILTEQSGLDNEYVSRGSATGDLDNDGDLDLISAVLLAPFNATDRKTKVFLNNQDADRNYCDIKLEGILSNKSAIGANVKLYANDRTLMKEVLAGNSHCSQSSKVLHFGLDTINRIDSIIIDWPYPNSIQLDTNILINTINYIKEDTTLLGMPIDTTDQMDTTVSTLNIATESNIILYPNPTHLNSLTISVVGALHSEEIDVDILDIHGYKVLTKRLEKPYSNNIIDIEDLTPGVYILRAKGTANLSLKFIKL